MKRRTLSIGSFVFFAVSFALALYFTFAAVQGDYGLFRRIQISAEADALEAERDAIQSVEVMPSDKSKQVVDQAIAEVRVVQFGQNGPDEPGRNAQPQS